MFEIQIRMCTDTVDPVEDQLLWEKFLSGDDKAYACIYRKYVKTLFSYGMQFTPNRELVKDCIQDVFVKIYSHRASLREIEYVKFYLFFSLKNTLLNVFQKDRSSCRMDMEEPVFCTEYHTVEDRTIADEEEAEQKEKMRRILDALTPRQKEAIYYRYVEEMELKDICILMDMNYQSVQNLIQRAVKKLKHTFSEKEKPVWSIKRIIRAQ
ncbi:MAG: sigma-70 family RNA polymerase sigma factor [Tannerellaceae bacterium]|jgi:RNA polymerase sigma factor (sigma-70 family)|nr:sigma-70 family RNA polymerase sigma factor [Tannerellaceae bacterium]